jgi:threonyl-tRNA synthetase
VGKNEQAEGKISLRVRGNRNLSGLDPSEVIAALVKEAGERRLSGSYS